MNMSLHLHESDAQRIEGPAEPRRCIQVTFALHVLALCIGNDIRNIERRDLNSRSVIVESPVNRVL